ncbi:MAG: hypothetical protein ACQEQV_09175 [Fibrobacterota bacterium]
MGQIKKSGSIFFVVLLLFFDISAAGFSDDHDDGVLTGWTAQNGNAAWSESGGFVTPPADENNNEGHLLNDYDAAPAGTLTVKWDPQYNQGVEENAGILFRWTNTSSYYYAYAHHDGTEYVLYVTENTMPTAPGAGTSFNTGVTAEVPFYVEIVMDGDNHHISIDGSSIGTFTDNSHSSGKIGYGAAAAWGTPVIFDSIGWVDVVNTPPTGGNDAVKLMRM